MAKTAVKKVKTNNLLGKAKQAKLTGDTGGLTIQKGIPIPEPASKNKLSNKYPAIWNTIDALEIGDAAMFDTKEKGKVIAAMQVKFHATTQKRFVMRAVDDTNSRIWRTQDQKRRGGRRKKGQKVVS